MKKIPRVLDLKLDAHSDKISLLHLHYEIIFECCFYCGLIEHNGGACLGENFERHYLLVDRYPQEAITFPANVPIDSKLNAKIPEGLMLVFPQPRRATSTSTDNSHGSPSHPSFGVVEEGWTKVTRKHRGKSLISKLGPSSVRRPGVSFRDMASSSTPKHYVPRRAPTPFKPPSQVLSNNNDPIIISSDDSSVNSTNNCEESSVKESDTLIH